MDFMRIWNQQELYPELREQIRVLCSEVYEFITREDRMTENVTEWCKKELCWQRAQKESWTILPAFKRSLISIDKVKSVEKEAKDTRKINNEVDSLKYILAMGSDYWTQVLDWGSNRRLLSDMEKSILKLVINIEFTGRTPSNKQIKVVLKARDRLINEGMPLHF